MSKMILSELLQARSSLVVQFVLCAAIGIFGGVGMQSPYAAFAMGFATFAFGHCIGMPYWDEQNDWQLLRLALPFSRRNIVFGRYVCSLVFLAIAIVIGVLAVLGTFAIASLLGISIEMEPLLGDVIANFAFAGALLVSILMLSCGTFYAIGFRFGLGRAGRWLIIGLMAFVIVACVVASAAGDSLGVVGGTDMIATIASMPIGVVVGAIFAVCALYYIATMVFSLRAYAKREF